MESPQISVLLIEDDADHRTLVESHLRRCSGVHFQLRTADCLAAGLRQLHRSTLDAVLLDLHLPDSSGLDTLRRVHECSSEVAVVVLSALADQELAVRAVQAGAQDYLVKSSISGELLSRAIRYAIERRKNETLLERLVHERTSELLQTNRRLEKEIEEHKLAREQLAEQQQQLLQAERLAAIGEVVTGLAHESRNALQRSQACLSMLAHRLEHHPKAEELLRRAQEAQDDLSRLHDQVRRYASPVQLQRQPACLKELVCQAWQQLDLDRAGRTAALDVDGPEDLACQLDRFAIVQVFRNLFENSLAACSDPVRITVSWRAHRPPDPLTITVSDNGPGFGPDQVGRLFQPFYTTKLRGTGLGLAISRRLIQAHGGEIAARNGNAGAVLEITLPRNGGF
jgi:C4-dicarboxylate-specific signal transduction histidine kinase